MPPDPPSKASRPSAACRTANFKNTFATGNDNFATEFLSLPSPEAVWEEGWPAF